MSTTNIECLPEVVIQYIFTYLSPYRDFKQCMLVNKAWCQHVKAVIHRMKRDFRQALIKMDIEWRHITSESRMAITKRYSHSTCVIGNSMFVFGGCTTANTTFNDLWKYDLGTRTWIRPLAMGTYPPPKACATLVSYDESLILFGGWTHTSPYPLHQQSWKIFNQVHIYNTVNNHWDHIVNTGECPRMAGHSATVHEDKMVVFGGLHCQFGLGFFVSSNQVWVLDLKTKTWHNQPVGTSLIQPLPRYGHSQINLDSTHALIVGGCGGPNRLYSDVWLLTMTETGPWEWQLMDIYQKSMAAPHLSFHPACRVGDKLVVLSKTQNLVSAPSSLPHLLRVPANIWMPPTTPDNSINMVPFPPPPPDDEEEEVNVNGRGKGVLKRQRQEGDSPEELSSEDEGSAEKKVAGPQDGPSVRPNARHNRQRQLEGLNRMEQRLRDLRTGALGSMVRKERKLSSGKNLMCVYVLDISKVLTSGEVTWLPASRIPGPEEIILYSLVRGRGEIIMFGGIQKNLTASTQLDGEIKPEVVSNSLHFITAPKFVI